MTLGTVLVLSSWVFLIVVVLILGLSVLIRVNSQSTKGLITPRLIRMSLWWGLLVSIIAVLIVNLFLPLSSALSAAIILIIVALALITVVIKRPGIQRISIPRRPWVVVITAVLFIATVFLAFAALGPVTNYDSGLYHLGAIKYSSDYPTITGLANLYFPFGYNTSLYPFAAFLGNGPWGAEGFRLVNGFIIAALISDLIVRLFASRGQVRKLSVGFWILLVAALIALVPMVTLSDYWVTSPSSDAPVMVLTFVACAYLADGLSKRTGALDLATSFVIAVILFSLRPTMAVFLIGILIVIGVSIVKSRTPNSGLTYSLPLLIAGVLGLSLLIVQTIRDYYLSGWLQFPLSIYSFGTPWSAIDPVGYRTATLGNARNPEDIWGSIEGFSWVSPWLGRLPDQWEPFLIIALALATLILAVTAKRLSIPIRIRLLTLMLIPSLLTTAVWFFFSPPAFRFGWGPIFSLFIIPIGVLVHGLMRNRRPAPTMQFIAPTFIGVLVIGVFTVTAYSATIRLPALLEPVAQQFTVGNLQIPYRATPVVSVPALTRDLTSGLRIEQPTESDQCWDNYPLCTPIISGTVTLREGNIQSGFLP